MSEKVHNLPESEVDEIVIEDESELLRRRVLEHIIQWGKQKRQSPAVE